MPPRPRVPRPPVGSIRRPRVAGVAPAGNRATAGADRPGTDTAAADQAPRTGRVTLGPGSRPPAGPAPGTGDRAAGAPAPVGANSAGPNAAGPNAVDPNTVDPNAVDPNTVDRDTVGLDTVALDTVALDTVALDTVGSDSGAVDRAAVDHEAGAATAPGRTAVIILRPKRRRDRAADSVAEEAPEPDAPAAGPGEPGRRSLRVPLLAVALVVLTGLAVFFGLADARLRHTPSAANTALVDVGATAEAAGQLTDALQTIYSYDFARLDENERAARAVITPEFADQFDKLFAQVRELAPQQQAVVSATVTVAAVKEITGDRAVLVAFMDQQATRAAAGDDGKATQLAAAGRLTVTGEKIDGRWKIGAVESK
jgi:Mce-associated membrane protein